MSRSAGAIARPPAGRYYHIAWLLRIACAWCFFGHGFWGFYQKSAWLPFYDVFGIPHSIAWATMPLIGLHDFALAILVLVRPFRALFVWMTVWCVFTALLRPLAGMGWWEFFERGGNFAPPLALAVLAWGDAPWRWWERCDFAGCYVAPSVAKLALGVLQVGVASLLIGHGGFAAFEAKPYLIEHWAAVGVVLAPGTLALLGWAEIAAGVAVLLTRAPPLLIGVAVWKVASELLYPIAGGALQVFEFIERGGDYFAPIAIIALGGALAAWASGVREPEASFGSV